MKLLAGSSIPTFAHSLSEALSVPLITAEIGHFPNGEKRVFISEPLSGEDILIIQSFSQPVDEHIMEFLLLADATERLGARSIHAAIPWLGYSLQDKVFRPGEPIAAKVVANLVSTANINRVYLFDLHNSSTPGFFSIPSVHISAQELFAQDVQKRFAGQELIVASPDFGGLKRAGEFAALLHCELVNIDKQRDLTTGEIISVNLHGTVTGKTVILFDDVIVSGGTVSKTAQLLKENGAVQTHFYATHGLFVGAAQEIIAASSIDSITVTNSIEQTIRDKKIRILDCAPLFAGSVQR